MGVCNILTINRAALLHYINQNIFKKIHLYISWQKILVITWNKQKQHHMTTDLWPQRLRRLQHVEQLWIVDLQEHTSDFSSQTGMHVLDEWEQTLTCGRGEQHVWDLKWTLRDAKQELDRSYHSPSICFCSCGGAAANMDAVSGSWPWTWTAGWTGVKQTLENLKTLL